MTNRSQMRIGDADIPADAVEAICRRWKIRRLELFGSVLAGRLKADSDIDLLVDFEPDDQWSLMDLVRAEQEFAALLGRKVQLVDRRSLEQSKNWIRRDAILKSSKVFYAA